jgi:hypothetical protein
MAGGGWFLQETPFSILASRSDAKGRATFGNGMMQVLRFLRPFAARHLGISIFFPRILLVNKLMGHKPPAA